MPITYTENFQIVLLQGLLDSGLLFSGLMPFQFPFLYDLFPLAEAFRNFSLSNISQLCALVGVSLFFVSCLFSFLVLNTQLSFSGVLVSGNVSCIILISSLSF